MKLRLMILALGNFAVGTGALVVAGILPTLAKDLNVSVTLAGQLITVYALTYGLAAPLLAAFTSTISRRVLLVSALVVLALANGLAALAPGFEILFVARILAGLSGAIYTPTSSAVAVSLAPPAQRGRALALVFVGLPVATVLGVPFGTLIGSNFGWRFTFGIVAVLSLVAAGAVLITIRQLTPPTLVRLSQWLALFKQPRIVLALSVTFWQYAAQFLIYSYIAPLLQKNAGLDGTGVSLMLFVAGVAGVLGNNLGGRIADRWSLTWTLCLELIGIAVCMFILPAASVTALGAGLILFVWCLIGFIFNPVQQARLIGLAPQSPGPMLSLNSSMLYLGNAAGAGFGGIIVSQWSLNATAWVGGILALVGLGALGWSVMQHQSPAPVASHTNEPVMND